MKLITKDQMPGDLNNEGVSQQQGFTLLESAIALVILMIIGLGIASLFTYSIRANGRADDREISMAIAQKRMEWMRTIPFTAVTRHQAFSYPNGGLEVTAAGGVNETVTSAGRSYVVNTLIENVSVVPAGSPEAGEPTVKRIQVTVTPLTAVTAFETVRMTTQRSTQVVGTF